MGHASSKEVRHEPQNPRRLSKPQTNSSSFNIAQPKVEKASKTANRDQTPLLDESMFWKSPWTGDLLPKVTPDLTDRDRVRSFPSFSALQPESPLLPQGSKRWSSLDDFSLMKNDSSLSRSGSYISRRLSRRRSSTQRTGLQSQSGELALRETRRESVIHIGPSDIGNHDQRSCIENLASEDWSPVEDSYVPLGRRQSFRRPGIATRTPSWGVCRTQLPSIQQEDEKEPLDASSASQLSRKAPCEIEGQEEYMPVTCSSNRRAASPVALDYSHLGGFKRGTLRVVNGSVSPACSDRVRLFTTSTLAREQPETVHGKEDTTLFTSSVNYHDDAIDLYYKNHNTSENRQPVQASEGIAMEAIDFTRREKAQSIANVDSGYSSLSSIRSDDSSGQSSSPPMDSPINNSPAQPEGRSPMDKEGCFYNQNNPENESYFAINEKSLANRENICHSTHAADPIAEPPRYYARLGQMTVLSEPERIEIDDRESDLGDSNIETDDDQSSLDRPDRFSSPRPNPDYVGLAVTTSQKVHYLPQIGSGLLAYGQEDFDAPRGRARSRSISHSYPRLVKTSMST